MTLLALRLSLLAPLALASLASAQPLSTYAGGGTDDGKLATTISFQGLRNVTVDAAGNVYVVDSDASLVRRVDARTGLISTVAGNGRHGYGGDGGPATRATFSHPSGVAIDVSGNLFISDTSNGRVRRVDAATGLVQTIAGGGNPADGVGDGGPATAAGLDNPWGISLDGRGSLYIGSTGSRVRKVSLSSGTIVTVAGVGTDGFDGDGGAATAAKVNRPVSVVADQTGNVFIADAANNRIRRVDAATGVIETLAGTGQTTDPIGDGGPALTSTLSYPSALALDAAGRNLYILDTFHNRIRKVALDSRTISTAVGGGDREDDGAPATEVRVGYYPLGMTLDGSGSIYWADSRVRRVSVSTGTATTLAGGGSYVGDGLAATQAIFRVPDGLAFDPRNGNLLIVDSFAFRVREVSSATKVISTRVGDGTYNTLPYPVDVAVDGSGNVYVALYNGGTVLRKDAQSGATAVYAGGGSPADNVGDNGPATSARIYNPRGVGVDAAGNLYIADLGGNRVRKVDSATRIITTVAGTGKGAGEYAAGAFSGDGGPATLADLSDPYDVAVDTAGNVFIVDQRNNRIRRVDRSGVITTVVGSGTTGAEGGGFAGDGGPATQAVMYLPSRIAFDAAGNLYVTGNSRVRRVDRATQVITTIAGNGSGGSAPDGGLATASPIDAPLGVAVDGSGNIYIAESGNNRVRVIPSSGCALPVISTQPRGSTIISGFAAVLTVEVTSTGTPTYQWYRGLVGDTSNPVSGATSPTFTTPPLTTTTTYWVRVRNDCGSVDSDAATVTVSTLLADLSLTMEAGPEPVPVGGRLTYTLTVRNNGPTAATGASIVDTLPSGVTLVSSTASQGSCTGSGTLTCALGSVVQGAEARVTIVISPTTTGTIQNRARVSAAETDPNEENNSAQRTSTVSPATSADVAVGQSASPSPARVQGLLTYTLFVANNGPAGSTNVSVVDTLPTGATFVSASALLGTCAGTGPVTCTIGSLAAGVSTTVTIVVRATTEGTLLNVATVTAAQGDPVADNNRSALDVPVLSNTAACPASPPTILASPRGVVRAGDTFTVSWSDVYGPTDPDGLYRAQLSSSADFAAGSLLRDLTTRNLSLSYPTASGGAATTLYFRISAVAGCGTAGAFSPNVSISVAPNPPSIIVTEGQSPPWTVAPNQLPPQATIRFKNIGASSTPVTFRSSGAFFTYSPGSAVMEPGQEIAVTLTPLAGSAATNGSQSGLLTADWTAASVTQSVYLTVTSTTSRGSKPKVDQDEVLLVKPSGPGSRGARATSESSVTLTNSGTQPIFLVPSVGPGGAWLKLDASQFATPLAPGQTRVLTIGSDPSKITPADYPLPIWTVLTVSAAGGDPTDSVQVKVFYAEETAVVSGAGRGFLSGGASSFIVPTAVHATGAGNTTFTSDGWLRNLSPDPVTFDVFATPSGQDGQVNALKVTQTISGFSTVRLFDFIQSLFGATSLAGPVEIRSRDAAQLSVRTTASGLPGTGDASSRYGTEIAVYGAGTGTGTGQPPLILTGIKDNAANRLNLILSETTGTTTVVNLRLFDSDGNELATKPFTVPALGNIQFRLNSSQGLGIPETSFEAASLLVEPVSGTGRVVAIGTLIDNDSGSFQGLTGRTLGTAPASARSGKARPLATAPVPRVIPSIVHAPGIGAYFTTELAITNGTASPAQLRLVYDYTGSMTGTATADVTIRGRGSLSADKARDVVVNLFGLPAESSTFGSLRIEGPGVGQVIARATVSTPVELGNPAKGVKGTEFQSYSGLSPEAVGIAKTPVVIYPGMQKYTGIRTNIILAEVSGQPARVRMRLINGTTGGVLSEVERTFNPWERAQINDMWNGDGGFGVGDAAFDKVSISLEPIGSEPGRVVGALAVIDNVTNSSRILVLAPPGPPQSDGIGF